MTVRLAIKIPKIKILLYTDHPDFSTSTLPIPHFALGRMIERLQGHAPSFAQISTTVVNRSADQRSNKLDAVLARESFDEIWFFGMRQANTAGEGETENELDQDEVDALKKWMNDGGGVLMTGDHASTLPSNLLADANSPCGTLATDVRFLGLGRAIGHCVPRAGLLRKWEGPPTSRTADSLITAENEAESDTVAQELLLQNVNHYGEPDPEGRPHPLFFYRWRDRYINSFPDHDHEGAVVIPKTLDADWPSGRRGQTRPHIIARGTHVLTGKEINILAAYNGDLAFVGRIVADSSFHHYVNLNLFGFEHPAQQGSAADQIGQFYANLAVWLAPRRKRVEMALAMCWANSQYTFLQEPVGNIERISRASQLLLSRSTLPCEAHELVQALLPSHADDVAEMADKKDFDFQPIRELFLGNVMTLYHEAMIEEQKRTKSQFNLDGAEAKFDRIDALLDTAFERALTQHGERLRKTLEAISPNYN